MKQKVLDTRRFYGVNYACDVINEQLDRGSSKKEKANVAFGRAN
jgi:hypothetical protein